MFHKKFVLTILQNSQKNACAGASFLRNLKAVGKDDCQSSKINIKGNRKTPMSVMESFLKNAPTGLLIVQINNGQTGSMCEIYLKLTTKTSL